MENYIKSFISELESDAGLITRTVHKETFLRGDTPEVLENTCLIIATFLCISMIHMVLLKIVRWNKKTLRLKNGKEVQKAAYQFTNMAVNCTLGIYGTYKIYNSPNPLALILPWEEPDLIKRITGYREFDEFFAYQLGYNLWALPVGIFKVEESASMILHHISVLTSTTLACYTNIGYRVFSAYIFGMAELSSVPLALMNLLKDRREWTKQNFPIGFAIVKVWFATSFLTLRVIVPTPMILDLLRSSFLVFSTMVWWKQPQFIDGTETFDDFKIGVCALDFVMRVCLGFLQYYWASLVLSGITKMAVGGPKSKSEDKKKKE